MFFYKRDVDILILKDIFKNFYLSRERIKRKRNFFSLYMKVILKRLIHHRNR
jgi:hypothetical protein